ncbi:MAG: GNAT family N-acetyltransferase [Nitrososphaerota archaeon]|nr:GNAT family N-acetyltransferase [Nitrososphaerota archaeon]MDG6979319.1 GNAT family N-acetyltransferase [Nitrososphaerota archaeon]
MSSRSEVTPSRYISPKECTKFECEKEKKGYADFVQNEAEALRLFDQNTAVTYLFKIEDEVVIGYVALAMASLPTKNLPEDLQKSHHYDHIPSLLLGQMACDIKFRGKGVGDVMIDYVIDKANELAQEIGCRLIIVDSELDSADCYKRNGLEPLPARKGADTVKMHLDLRIPHTRCKVCGHI